MTRTQTEEMNTCSGALKSICTSNKAPVYQLRTYQQRAIAQIEATINCGCHSIMIASPTGSGKGVMLSHIINDHHQKGSTVLFLVHLEEILFQVSEYMDKWGIEHGVPDRLGAAYNRTQFIVERRKMMQQWADYLDDLKSMGK